MQALVLRAGVPSASPQGRRCNCAQYDKTREDSAERKVLPLRWHALAPVGMTD
jgi:hypothetical protein